MTEAIDVVVALGTRLVDLATTSTRWRQVLSCWSSDPRVGSLTVLDYPRFGPRPRMEQRPTWLPGVTSFGVTVAGRRAEGPLTSLGWTVTGRAVDRRLPGTAARRVVVAATPLAVPLLPHLAAARRCFDAVDDWRFYPPAEPVRDRIVTGYRLVAGLDSVTAVSEVLAGRLVADFGAAVRVVGNGVDVGRYQDVLPMQDPRLPSQPFAVYIGNVQERVDRSLLEHAAARIPVVVAGPATDEAAHWLGSGPVTWLGPVHTDQVPALLARASVGLLPHHVSAFTQSMDPMKLLEYLAAGLPVVATDLPGLERWAQVTTAPDAEAFTAAVLAAVARGRDNLPSAMQVQDWCTVADALLTTYAGGLC